jgi:RNA polymerase subunit RPABC4/transcription elongation factor Spt4
MEVFMGYKHKGYLLAFCLIPVSVIVTASNPTTGVILTVIAVSFPFLFPYSKMQICPYCGKKNISVTLDDDHKTCPACQKKCLVKNGNLLITRIE